jgi:hypothetical protein
MVFNTNESYLVEESDEPDSDEDFEGKNMFTHKLFSGFGDDHSC